MAGTRFSTDANGEILIIKGLSHTVLTAFGASFDSPDQAADWNYEVVENGGNIEVSCTNAHTGAQIDFSSAIGAGDVIHFHYAYISQT